MQYSDDTLDLALLRSNRDAFILLCQPIIEIVSKNYIKTGLFRAEHFKDIVQAVNEELIARLPMIERNYNGKVLMVTYINAVIRNICLDHYRKEGRSTQTLLLDVEEQSSDGDAIVHSLIVRDELRRFTITLSMFHEQRPKLLLCLKLFFRLPVSVTDLTGCFDRMNMHEAESVLKNFDNDFDEARESEIFNMIAPLMNQKDGNSTTGQSLRRWTQEQIMRIISILNSGSAQRTHTRETIKILMDYYSQQP